MCDSVSRSAKRSTRCSIVWSSAARTSSRARRAVARGARAVELAGDAERLAEPALSGERKPVVPGRALVERLRPGEHRGAPGGEVADAAMGPAGVQVGAQVVRGRGALERREAAVHLAQRRVPEARGALVRQPALEPAAGGVDLLQLGAGERRDARALVRTRDDEALLRELAQRDPHGRDAHLELRGQLAVGQARARGQAPGQDRGPQLAGERLLDRALAAERWTRAEVVGHRRSTSPARSPVGTPARSVTAPLTTTCSIPVASCVGRVERRRARRSAPRRRSPMSAWAPGRSTPRPGTPSRSARQGREPPHRLLRGEQARLADHEAVEPRRPAVGAVEDRARQRPVGRERRRVRAGHAERVRERLALLALGVAADHHHQRVRRAGRLEQQVVGGVQRLLPALGGQGGEVAAGVLGADGVLEQHDAAPVAALAEDAAVPLHARPGRPGRAGSAASSGPAGVRRPGRQHRGQVGEAEQARVHVEGDVEPALAGAGDRLQAAPALLLAAARDQVRDLQPAAGPRGRVDAPRSTAVGGAAVAAARVGGVERAAAGRHRAQALDLGGGRGRLGRVLEPGRVAPGALLERLLERARHRRRPRPARRGGRRARRPPAAAGRSATRLSTLTAGRARSSRSK